MALVNYKSLAGQIAGHKSFFGEFGRYAVAAVYTRFEEVAWFVWDADKEDEITGFADAIGQFDSKEKAVSFAKSLPD